MNYALLVAYYRFTEFCQRKKMYGGDCIVFVTEETRSLVVRPVSLTDESSTDRYLAEMTQMSQKHALEETIHVKRIDVPLLEKWMTKRGYPEIEEDLHVFQLEEGRLVVMTRDGMAAISKDT
jgi:hypothetical protein